jgi:hypothetical protein
MTTFNRIRSALPSDDDALRAEIQTAVAEAEQRMTAGAGTVRVGAHLDRLAGLLEHRKTAAADAERRMIDRSIRVTVGRLTWTDINPVPPARKAAPSPAVATRAMMPKATAASHNATSAPSPLKAHPAADPAPATARRPDVPVAASAAGPLAAEIEAGEKALRDGRAAIIGSGARVERIRAAQDFAAECEAADRAMAAGRAKIVEGGAAFFPRPELEPVETASKPLVDRAKSRWDRDPALRAEFGYRFDQYLAYRKAAERQAARDGRQ